MPSRPTGASSAGRNALRPGPSACASSAWKASTSVFPPRARSSASRACIATSRRWLKSKSSPVAALPAKPRKTWVVIRGSTLTTCVPVSQSYSIHDPQPTIHGLLGGGDHDLHASIGGAEAGFHAGAHRLVVRVHPRLPGGVHLLFLADVGEPDLRPQEFRLVAARGGKGGVDLIQYFLGLRFAGSAAVVGG